MRRQVLVLLAAYAAIAVVVVGVGWLIIHPLAGPVQGFDDPISRSVAEERRGWLDTVAEAGTLLGDTPVGLGVGAAAALLGGLALRSLVPAVFVALADGGHGGVYWLATHADPRDRPPVEILDPGLVPDHSFPSGHVGTAVAVYGAAAVLLAVWLRLRGVASRAARLPVVLLACVPLVVAASRLYQGAHHLTDILTSLAYGSVWLAVLVIVLRLVPRSARGLRDAPVPHR